MRFRPRTTKCGKNTTLEKRQIPSNLSFAISAALVRLALRSKFGVVDFGSSSTFGTDRCRATGVCRSWVALWRAGCDAAFARAGGPIDGDNDMPKCCGGLRRTFGPAHPRFFVPLFGRAVKPKRLLFPALAPAANAGLRFPLEVRASIRTSLRVRAVLRLRPAGLPAVFAPFAWPLCLPQAGVVDFPFLAPAPLPLGRCEVPFDRAEAVTFFEEELPLVLPFVVV